MQDGYLVSSSFLANPVFQFLHSFMHHLSRTLFNCHLQWVIITTFLMYVHVFSEWREAFPWLKETVRKWAYYLGYTFQVLPQFYLHSPIVCYGMAAWDLLLFVFLTSVKWTHYIDNIILTCENLPLWQKTLQAFLGHIQERELTVNLKKI